MGIDLLKKVLKQAEISARSGLSAQQFDLNQTAAAHPAAELAGYARRRRIKSETGR